MQTSDRTTSSQEVKTARRNAALGLGIMALPAFLMGVGLWTVTEIGQAANVFIVELVGFLITAKGIKDLRKR